MTYASEVAADAPYIWLRCGDSSAPLVDSGSGGFDLTPAEFNLITYNVTGLQTSDTNGAVQFSAGDEFDGSDDFSADTGTAFTFELLANLSAFDVANLCGFRHGELGLEIDGSGGVFGNFIQFPNSYTGTPVGISLNATTYLATTFDGATGDLIMYVNGVPVDTVATGATGYDHADSPDFFCGPVADGGGIAGTVDELAWYRTALSPARIAAHYAAVSATLVDYGFSVGGTTFGPGTAVLLDLPGIEGLGVPDAKTQDVVWNLRDGAYANPDYTQVRVITIPIIVRAATEADAMTNLSAVETAFANSATNTTLQMHLPGWGAFSASGRPRGVQADLTLARSGVVRALARFDCPDPTITYAP